MAGLMGFFDDPMTQLAVGLMGAQGPNLGNNIAQAFQYMQLQRAAAERRQHDDLQQQMMGMQLDQQKKTMAEQEQRKALAQKFMRPGAQNLTPNDDEGNPMPSSPPNFDFGGYAQAMAGFDPMESLKIQQALQKEKPKAHALSEGQILADEYGNVLARGNPKKEGMPRVGDLREVKTAGNVITYQWDGKDWKPFATSPQFKPDGPEKPQPGHYDSERGVMVDPRTGVATPVTMNGQPIPQKPQKPTEQYLKQQTGVQNVQNAIGEYRDALKKMNAVDFANPDARQRMGTVYNNMLLQAKEAYNLGVLNGPDYMILQQVIANPMSLRGFVTSKGALDDQAAKLEQLMQKIGQTSAQVHGQPAQQSGLADPLGIRGK